MKNKFNYSKIIYKNKYYKKLPSSELKYQSYPSINNNELMFYSSPIKDDDIINKIMIFYKNISYNKEYCSFLSSAEGNNNLKINFYNNNSNINISINLFK